MAGIRFDGRVALITGGGRGIGRAHALLLASRGCRVVIADAGFDITGASDSGNPAADVAAEITADNGITVAFHGDVTQDAERMVAFAVEQFGRLDIVINNAGPVGGFKLFAEADAAAWQRVTEIHYLGTVAVCRAAWKYLARSDHGRIINTSSTAMLGSECQTDYGSAKAAIFGLTRSLALEGRAVGINVNCILPSGFTRMMETTIADVELRDRTRELLQPDHIAAFVAWLAHHTNSVSGEAFNVGGGRAARIVLAAGPAVKLDASTAEQWDLVSDQLFASGLKVATTMTENFAEELRDISPALSDALDRYLKTGLDAPASSVT